MKGTIFNIQRFSTHDGPGIRTVVFIKGCPLRCRWCQNPESQTVPPVLLHRAEACLGCGKCSEVCPHQAMSLADGVSQIKRRLCTGCGKCAGVCPAGALSLSGREVTADEVMAELLKDRAYYRNSGGGVTLSGGEATFQPGFSLELLRRCREKYINTALETCGFAPTEALRRFIPLTDLFLYDLKAIDSKKHFSGTGQDNSLILKNAKMLLGEGCNVIFRTPLIPGFNDSAKDILALRKYAESELGISPGRLELLKYNKLGEAKFTHLGRSRPDLKPQSDEYFESLKALLR